MVVYYFGFPILGILIYGWGGGGFSCTRTIAWGGGGGEGYRARFSHSDKAKSMNYTCNNFGAGK